uniref:DUF4806 domain-containing protein n=1 Tax=Anopheles coluzzii TaxID=1518534 RepID=A0A6E8WBK8_ANOCL|nr:uncharacterized protein LOC120958281 [Anopheles coluzzii]XP_040236897.2 uncharacterized protein LOC120958281 [Anopheles coluzzii]XP_040236898.2 uncharacterized protein LOC120958281 [Anopheles coluzzii]XP_040236899.2 uncharacterized protein LOC120958281 [Anopheles coluzzii]
MNSEMHISETNTAASTTITTRRSTSIANRTVPTTLRTVQCGNNGKGTKVLLFPKPDYATIQRAIQKRSVAYEQPEPTKKLKVQVERPVQQSQNRTAHQPNSSTGLPIDSSSRDDLADLDSALYSPPEYIVQKVMGDCTEDTITDPLSNPCPVPVSIASDRSTTVEATSLHPIWVQSPSPPLSPHFVSLTESSIQPLERPLAAGVVDPNAVPAPTDVLQLIAELSATMNRRFDELAAQIESLHKGVSVVRQTALITEAVLNRVQNAACPNLEGSAPPISEGFIVQPIRSKEELNAMEQKLGEKLYMEDCVGWLQKKLVSPLMNKRLMKAKNLVFDATFAKNCRWSARNNKIALSSFPNVCELFRRAASTSTASVTPSDVSDFFTRVLRYVK